MKQAGAEAVAALLQANPDAASKADRVRSGGDLGCCASIVCSRVLQYVYTYINTNVYIYKNNIYIHIYIYIYIYI